MSAQVFAFARRAPRSSDWAQQELAEFYRVEGALVRAGIGIETCRGVTDEGDPWFAFCRADNGDVFVHIARIDGEYVVDGVAFDRPARGHDFAVLIRDLVARCPTAPKPARRDGNVFVHPSALLIALVGAAFFQSHEAKAAETSEARPESRRSASLITVTQAPSVVTPGSWAQDMADNGHFAAVLVSAMLTLYGETVAAHEAPAELGIAHLAPDLPLAAAAGLPGQTSGAWRLEDFAVLPSQVEMSRSVADTTLATLPSVTVEIADASAAMATASEQVNYGGKPSEDAGVPSAAVQQPHQEKPVFLETVLFNTLHTDAAEVMGALRALADLLSRSLPVAADLPADLRDLITRGDHLDYNSLPGSTPVPTLGGTPLPPLDLPSTPGPQLPLEPAPKPFTLDDAIAQFIARVGHVEMVVEGQQMVIYDPDILNPLTRDVNFTSVTFTFPDGSTVSLVGTAAEIHSVWGGLG